MLKKGQKDKRSNGQTTINKTLHSKLKFNKMNPTKMRGWTEMLLKSKQFLLHMRKNTVFILRSENGNCI